MQQQPPPMITPMQGQLSPTANISTEVIQKECNNNSPSSKYLDENKQLIMAILDNQNLGKLSECATYQARLQNNLMCLAAIADAQPQISAPRPQMVPAQPMAQGVQYMQQHPSMHQINHPQMQGYMSMNNGTHVMHPEGVLGIGNNSMPPTSSPHEYSKGSAPGSSFDGRGNTGASDCAPLEQRGSDADNN